MNTLFATIFDVQGFSVHDGPGSRTTVFLKGCPLKCQWCANPESWDMSPEIMWSSFKCKGCYRCIDSCKKNAISLENNRLYFDQSKCKTCSQRECLKNCFYSGISLMGEKFSMERLMDELQRQRDSWGSEGGVTFSGGEPLIQFDFLKTALKNCRDRYIHTAIETTAFCPKDKFLDVMQFVDFAFIDIKHMDPEKHLEKTGVSNLTILSNIKALKESHWDGRVIIRTPVIEGFNDNIENISAQADFMLENNLKEINLLPFHRMGESKWFGTGKDYPYSNYNSSSDDTLLSLKNIFQSRGIQCYLGSDTPF